MEDAAQLAAYIYKVRYGDDKTALQNKMILKELIQADLLRHQPPEEWIKVSRRQNNGSSFERYGGRPSNDHLFSIWQCRESWIPF